MNTPKGTRIITGQEARLKYDMEMVLSTKAFCEGFNLIYLPSIDYTQTYKDLLDPDLRMYEFEDKKGRELCLRPECTNTLSQMEWEPDTKVYYIEKCWRYDSPQRGRWREFTQFGVEWLNPSCNVYEEMLSLASALCKQWLNGTIEIHGDMERGSHYYKDGRGFEITYEPLGSSKQVAGGGVYKNGVGFAIGVDRLVLAYQMEQSKNEH